MFQWPRSLFIAVFLVTLGWAPLSQASLRDRLKERWIKKQQEVPPPAASSDVTSKIEKPGDFTFTFKHRELARYYKVHVPRSYSGSRPMPVVLAFHGGMGNMDIQATDEYYKQISKSEAAGYIAVFPNGFSKLPSGQLATWNAGKCCAAARDSGVDDVGFIKEVLQHLAKQLNIDSQRIYAIGMSNGGMMAYRLACEMPDRFAAIAAVAGTDNTISCSPSKPVSVLHIHAKNDDHVLFNGGAGNTFGDKSTVTDFTSVPATIEKWRKLNGCEETPKRSLERKGAYCERYAKCRSSSLVQLCVTETGGHSWPGGKKPRRLSGTRPSDAISATDVIWDFFNERATPP